MTSDATGQEGQAERLAFLHEHWDRSVRLAQVYSRSTHMADDVCNTAWSAFFHKFDEFKQIARQKNDEGYLVSMLIRIIRLRAIDLWRASEREICVADDALNAHRERQLRDRLVDRLGGDVALRVDVERALAELKPRERDILARHAVDELVPEISAEELDISRRTYFRILKRATAKLRRSRHLAGYQATLTQKEGARSE